MSENRHTPGPWKECGATRGGCQCGQVWALTVDKQVATAHHLGEAKVHDFESQEVWIASEDEMKANARLIAAAPDLLEALKAFLTDYDDPMQFGCMNGYTAEKARAAIAKAEGKTE